MTFIVLVFLILLPCVGQTTVGPRSYSGLQDFTGATGVPVTASAYGAKGDFRSVTDASCSSSSSPSNISSPTAAFSSADVGRLISVFGAGASSSVLATTISSVNSPTVATVSSPCVVTVSSARIEIASDDTASIQNCINSSVGGVCHIPYGVSGTYVVSSPLTIPSSVTLEGSYGSIRILWASGKGLMGNCNSVPVSCGLLSINNASSVTVRDLIIDANYAGNGGARGSLPATSFYTNCIFLGSASNVQIYRNKLTGAFGSGTAPYSGTLIILSVGSGSSDYSTLADIHWNLFSSDATVGSSGIQAIVGGNTSKITENSFIACGVYMSEGGKWTITDNYFSGTSTKPTRAIESAGADDSIISGNIIVALNGIVGGWFGSIISNNHVLAVTPASGIGIDIFNTPVYQLPSRLISSNRVARFATGIFDEAGQGDLIRDNNIANNTTGIRIGSSAHYVSLSGNSFNSVQTTALQIDSGALNTTAINNPINGGPPNDSPSAGVISDLGTGSTIITGWFRGQVTLSGGAGLFTFPRTNLTVPPQCVASGAAASVMASSSTTTLTLTGTGSDVVSFQCTWTY